MLATAWNLHQPAGVPVIVNDRHLVAVRVLLLTAISCATSHHSWRPAPAASASTVVTDSPAPDNDCRVPLHPLTEAEAKMDACMIGCDATPPVLVRPGLVKGSVPALSSDKCGAGEKCLVVVEAVIDANGCVIWAKAVKGKSDLYQEAVEQVWSWRFRPARRKDSGEPLKTGLTVVVRFRNPDPA